jgi:hypothetical protein
MKMKFFFSVTLFALTITCFGQQDTSWDKWVWLIGEWKGEGSGQPGQGSGIFSFSYDLDKKVLTRKSHSEYPASDNKPQIIHDDLMIIYLDLTGNLSKAIYFDNEGHVINYTINYSNKSIIFKSDKVANAPIFRLTYTSLDDKKNHTKFEISQDGDKFITYIEGISKKIE